VTRRRSPNSAGAIYLDRAERIAALREAAGRAVSKLPSIRRVILFGSLANGIPTPRSDADLLVEVETSDEPESRDRVPAVLLAMSPRPCPVDLFVLTSEEIERSRAEGSPLLRIALGSGIDLL
jgi:predicted nucleotidyltransferase